MKRFEKIPILMNLFSELVSFFYLVVVFLLQFVEWIRNRKVNFTKNFKYKSSIRASFIYYVNDNSNLLDYLLQCFRVFKFTFVN